MTQTLKYTYEEFTEGLESIVHQVLHSGFDPDYVVGIVRGGAVPAVYISHKLDKEVQMVHWSLRDKGDGNESNCWIPEDILDGKKILIVDDIVDSGKTVESLLADWQSSVRNPLKLENVKVAALWYNTAQPFVVDYFHRTINRDEDSRWIEFPWEYV